MAGVMPFWTICTMNFLIHPWVSSMSTMDMILETAMQSAGPQGSGT